MASQAEIESENEIPTMDAKCPVFDITKSMCRSGLSVQFCKWESKKSMKLKIFYIRVVRISFLEEEIGMVVSIEEAKPREGVSLTYLFKQCLVLISMCLLERLLQWPKLNL